RARQKLIIAKAQQASDLTQFLYARSHSGLLRNRGFQRRVRSRLSPPAESRTNFEEAKAILLQSLQEKPHWAPTYASLAERGAGRLFQPIEIGCALPPGFSPEPH